MALIDIIKKGKDTPSDTNKLSSQEIQFLLQLLKEASIKGAQVEQFYNLVVKLQNQFTEVTSN